MTETGIEIGIETGKGKGTETEIATENGIVIETVIESLTKLHNAAPRDGGDAPLHHPHPTRGAADALKNGKNYFLCGECFSKHTVIMS